MDEDAREFDPRDPRDLLDLRGAFPICCRECGHIDALHGSAAKVSGVLSGCRGHQGEPENPYMAIPPRVCQCKGMEG